MLLGKIARLFEREPSDAGKKRLRALIWAPGSISVPRSSRRHGARAREFKLERQFGQRRRHAGA